MKTTICPFCETAFPLDKKLCPNTKCGAYRVNENNYNIPLNRRKDMTKEYKIIVGRKKKNGKQK